MTTRKKKSKCREKSSPSIAVFAPICENHIFLSVEMRAYNGKFGNIFGIINSILNSEKRFGLNRVPISIFEFLSARGGARGAS